MNDIIANTIIPMIEGYPTILSANILSNVITEINVKKGFTDPKEYMYKLQVYPVVFPHDEDCRKDKKADYTIMKVRNARTVVVVELKLSVAQQ